MAGESYVVPTSDDPRRFEPGSELLHESGRRLVVETARRHNARLLVKFEGIESRAEAESLRGAAYVSAADLRELDETEFWEHDVMGARVTTAEGEELGTVMGLVFTPLQDLLVVETDRGERYVPLVGAIVVQVDVAAGRIVVDPPEGLFD